MSVMLSIVKIPSDVAKYWGALLKYQVSIFCHVFEGVKPYGLRGIFKILRDFVFQNHLELEVMRDENGVLFGIAGDVTWQSLRGGG